MSRSANRSRALAGIAPEAAELPFVVALDVGTSSVRAMLFDARGLTIQRMAVQIPYQMRTTAGGGVEADAPALAEKAVQAIDSLLVKAGRLADRIAAVAVDTFWHSLLGVDAASVAITPLYTWADTRAVDQAQALKTALDEESVHARTGCQLHSTYPPAKLRWVAECRPDVFRQVSCWMTFGEYLYLKLFGTMACSVSMASGSGLFDQHRCCWDEEMLDATCISMDQLAPLVDRQDALYGLAVEYAARWPALATVPWYPAIADGAANNVGSGCFDADHIAVMIGTSGAMRVVWRARDARIPHGLWVYRADRQRFVMGGVLSSGGNVVKWMRDTLRLDVADTDDPEIASMAPDGHGLTVLPFLAGERSTGWAPHAQAVLAGLTLHTRPVDILRAGMESVALRFAEVYSLLCQELPSTTDAGAEGNSRGQGIQVIATGGALVRSATWMTIIADALGCPVVASTEPEATSRGTALLALESLGLLPDLAAAPVLLGQTFEPSPERHAIYREALARQKRLYASVIEVDGPSRLPHRPG